MNNRGPRELVSLEHLAPSSEFYVNSGKFSGRINEILDRGGIEKGGAKVTTSDLFYLPEEYVGDENKLYSLLRRELDVNDIDNGETLFKLNKALELARGYLKDYLRIDLPREIEFMDDFSDIEDVFSFLRKTKGLGEGENSGVFAPMYCALATVMGAEWEYIKGDLKHLEEDATTVFDELLAYKGGSEDRIIKKKKTNDGWNEVEISSPDGSIADGVICKARGKGHYRVISKMLAKVNYDRMEAINDGIGLRFEIPDGVDIKKLTPFLLRFLKSKFNASELVCKNNNLCSRGEVQEMEEILSEEGVGFRDRDNKLSDNNYRAFGIEGKLIVDGKRNQPFEVQIVRIGNRNEEGMTRHEIYEPLQKLSVMSRLFGAVSEEYLEQMMADASEETGIPREEIKDYFLKKRGVRELNINGRIRYVAGDHIARMVKAQIIPEEGDL